MYFTSCLRSQKKDKVAPFVGDAQQELGDLGVFLTEEAETRQVVLVATKGENKFG
jgi:hypothetical protein